MSGAERDALVQVVLAASPGTPTLTCLKIADAILASEWLAERDRCIKAEALREHRRRVVRFMPNGLVSRAMVVADLAEYADRIEATDV